MKTKKGWDKSNVDLDVYLPVPCEVDEALFLYVAEIVPAKYCSREHMQGGDPEKAEHGVYFYMTFSQINGKYYYLGVLPEFQQ